MPMSILAFLGQLALHGQNYMVYPSAFLPRPRDVELPSYHGVPYEDIQLTTSDGIILHCYLLQPDSSKSAPEGTVIIFHGNGMNYGDTIEAARHFYRKRLNVLMLSYRGYGHSNGSPSEKGLKKDATAALDYVLAAPRMKDLPVILYGTSLGGGVAIDLASRNPSKIHALIVENTFTSIPNLVRDFPVIGRLWFICHQRWNSASKIPLLPTTLPILMLSGDRDQVVPQKHMHKLWEIAAGRGKGKGEGEESTDRPVKDVFKNFRYGTHVDTYVQPGYWNAVDEFISSLNSPATS